MSRLRALEHQAFDVAIIGGGIVGCGVARDAARRGLRVALFEKSDFGSGTTAASTRIVHGGLRYLETGDLRLVRLDLRERETLLHIAAHLVKPLAFAIPFDAVRALQALKLRAGLTLYDLLASRSSLPRHRATAREAIYYDARVDSPERLCIENLLDAAAHGAQAFNYVAVTGVRRDAAGVTGVQVDDALTADACDVRTRAVVNASGPWFERVASLTGHAPGRIRTTKGVHIVCPSLTDRAEVRFSRVDGRLMFAIPRAGLTWLGTTDTDYVGDASDAVATRQDVDYIIESFRGAFPALTSDDVLFTTAGVRALVMQPGSASSVSRLHRIAAGDRMGSRGVVSIMGAKITGYRAIAEDATDAVCRQLGVQTRCSTADVPLPGADAASTAPLRWPHLRGVYGSRASRVEALALADASLAAPLSPNHPDIGAQIAVAVREEYCQTVADFIRRRSLIGLAADQGASAIGRVADVLGRELGWSAADRQRQIDAFAGELDRSVTFRR